MNQAFEVVIGLEVHAQLTTHSKVFCTSENRFDEEVNSRVGAVSAGMPGALPTLNREVVRKAIIAGLALESEIQSLSCFARKNYFYPDLPKGYQITQHTMPICVGGQVNILVGEEKKVVRLHHIHIEEDAGKSQHFASHSLVNLNRSGVPLIEIVSEPDLRSPAEASAYMRKVHATLVYAGITDGNMEEGNFRCDANVSIRPRGSQILGTRTEIKNVNSFRFIEKALDFEIARQIAVVGAGGVIVQETRGFDSVTGKTYSMRSKEEAHDYRYFPDPDLPPLRIEASFVELLRASMPELPDQKISRYMDSYGLSARDSEALVADLELSVFFESCVALGVSAQSASNWIQTELLALLNQSQDSIASGKVSATQLADLIQMVESGKLSGKMAKSLLKEVYGSDSLPSTVAREQQLSQESDVDQITQWVQTVIERNPSQVIEYREGKEKLFAFFVGQVMRFSVGRANPEILQKVLMEKLKK